MNVLVVSLNFHPGHFSHLVANYKLFMNCGYSPYLFVHKKFNRMDEMNEFNKINSSSELMKLQQIDIAVFWFPSIRNIVEILRLRILFKSRIIYIYHEPFDSILNYYKSGFRFKKILKICLINVINIPVILLSHCIVLPSKASFSLYQKKYTYLNNNYSLIPLLFDDEADFSLKNVPKNFISYIGTVASDHAFDRFVNFVDSSINNDWFPDLQFLIATSSIIPFKERYILEKHILSGKVVISEGLPMSNSEINAYFMSSIIVWNAYNRSMQSGILPKAYMFGAAVIVLTRNANEFIADRLTGILINDNNNVIEIKNAVCDILQHKKFYFQNCRNQFLKYFYYKNKIPNFLSLIPIEANSSHNHHLSSH
jgi:hypothetical protein